MRIAVAGKGGAGKTTISAILSRLAARTGRRVVCIDADSNPNLAVALGMGTADPGALPVGIVSRRLDGGPALTATVDEVLATHSLEGPDGVRLARMGSPRHAEEGCMCSAHAVVRAALADLGNEDTLTVVDLEASPEHFSRGTARHVDTLVLVAEPYFRSLETVRRMADLARELPIPTIVVVANKVRDPRDLEAIEEFCARHGTSVVGSVPFDTTVLDADRDRVPLIERDPDGAVVGALRGVLDRLLALAPATP